MKTLIAICFCGLSISLSAQTTLRTFTSPDGIFQFKYSDVLVDCTSVGKQENIAGASVRQSCMTQGAICDGPGSGGTALACFTYPKEKVHRQARFCCRDILRFGDSVSGERVGMLKGVARLVCDQIRCGNNYDQSR